MQGQNNFGSFGIDCISLDDLSTKEISEATLIPTGRGHITPVISFSV